jgi:hypothetical protein
MPRISLEAEGQDQANTIIEHSQNFILKLKTAAILNFCVEIFYIFLIQPVHNIWPPKPDHDLPFPAPFSIKDATSKILPAYMIRNGNVHYGYQVLTNGSGTYVWETRSHISPLSAGSGFFERDKIGKYLFQIYKNNGDFKPVCELQCLLTWNFHYPPIKSDRPIFRYPFTLQRPIPISQTPLPCSNALAPSDVDITIKTIYLPKAPELTTLIFNECDSTTENENSITSIGLTLPKNFKLSLFETNAPEINTTKIKLSDRFRSVSPQPLQGLIPFCTGIPLTDRFKNFHKGNVMIQLTNIPTFNSQTHNKIKNMQRKAFFTKIEQTTNTQPKKVTFEN